MNTDSPLMYEEMWDWTKLDIIYAFLCACVCVFWGGGFTNCDGRSRQMRALQFLHITSARLLWQKMELAKV